MKTHRGFTLLEIMLVIVVIGVLSSIAVPNVTWGSDEDRVANASRRFKAIFDLASEYAMLNNAELGLILKDNNYRFVAFDGQRWVTFAAEKYFEPSKHDEDIELKLELEGLLWAENSLINEVTFEVEEDDENKDKEMLSPQIFILSSGDITPFRLTFSVKPDFANPIYFQVMGDFTTPLTIDGPLDKLP